MLKILRFNWPKYVLGVVLSLVCLVSASGQESGFGELALYVIATVTLFVMIASLLASWYVYDHCDVESFDWLGNFIDGDPQSIVSVHVGYDDAERGLRMVFSEARVTSSLFRVTHTPWWRGRSLVRAVATAGPHHEAQETISSLTERGERFDLVVLGFSAHEARDRGDRHLLLERSMALLSTGGTILLIEHLLDGPNLVAYGPGALHFQTKGSWLSDIESAGLESTRTQRICGLVTVFQLVLAPS